MSKKHKGDSNIIKPSWFEAEQVQHSNKSGGHHGYVCYKTHPALVINGFKIYGGSCSTPVVLDADIYIGLDRSMAFGIAPPWTGGVEFLYHITDMHAPSTASEFIKLVEWLCNQLHDNKKIHIGCLGGHGRTGTLLAAMVKVATGEDDAIEFVRNNYCKKAVESKSQVDFLHTQFGITKVEPTKGSIKHDSYHAVGGHYYSGGSNYSSVMSRSSSSVRKIEPTIHTTKNIWADPKHLTNARV